MPQVRLGMINEMLAVFVRPVDYPACVVVRRFANLVDGVGMLDVKGKLSLPPSIVERQRGDTTKPMQVEIKSAEFTLNQQAFYSAGETWLRADPDLIIPIEDEVGKREADRIAMARAFCRDWGAQVALTPLPNDPPQLLEVWL